MVQLHLRPFGKLGTISYIVAAGAVQAPSRVVVAATSSTIAISISVVVNVSLPLRTAIMTFARMGIVLRRSTTLWTWASALIRVLRSAFSFMVRFLIGFGRC